MNDTKLIQIFNKSICYLPLRSNDRGTIICFNEKNKKYKLKTNFYDANIKAFAKSYQFLWFFQKNPNQIIKMDIEGNIVKIIDLTDIDLNDIYNIKMWANDKNVYFACKNLFSFKTFYQVDSYDKVHKIYDKLRICSKNVHITENSLYICNLEKIHIIYNDTQFIEQYIIQNDAYMHVTGIYDGNPAYINYHSNLPVFNILNIAKNCWENIDIPNKELYNINKYKVDNYVIKAFWQIRKDEILIQTSNYTGDNDLYFLNLKNKKIKRLFTLKNDSFTLCFADNKYIYLYLSEPINDKASLIQIDIYTGMQKIVESQMILLANNTYTQIS